MIYIRDFVFREENMEYFVIQEKKNTLHLRLPLLQQ